MRIRRFRKGYTQTSQLGYRHYLEKLNFASTSRYVVRELYIPPNVCNCRCLDTSSVTYTDFRIFTCESRSSSGSPQSVHLSDRPSARYTFGMPSLCKICNSKSFRSILFKLCIMVVHILKMCISFLCTFHEYFLIFEGC